MSVNLFLFMKKILIIGSEGQIGSELTVELRRIYNTENVITADIKTTTAGSSKLHFKVNVMNKKKISEIVKNYKIDTIINLAAILSAKGEKDPMTAWKINIKGLLNVLEIAREYNLSQVFIPSSIAVFGPQTTKNNTSQETILKPTTMYGITKVVGELLGEYYVSKYGLDVRGLRYPGIISSETPPGGGTTDYAVEMFYAAVKNKKYTCFVREDTKLPMMYMPDCIKATIDLMHADRSKLKHHCDFNVSAMSFTAGELANCIKKYIPDFQIEYKPDYRQEIADSWPQTIDDSYAREEWNWCPHYGLDSMTYDMIEKIKKKREC